ncbi:chromate efflux transporter [Paenibacillus sp. M1]|uniref:Chromate efflux transporter n=1 Tax=Paenibacillus haidiansis TaxID=1574488 RepID=A0ABU7VQH1_9BACL
MTIDHRREIDAPPQPEAERNSLSGSSALRRLYEIWTVSAKLGLTSFGGPIAHLGYFHEEYVKKRKWLDEKDYAELVALCQFLPGPASSQVGIGIGLRRGGLAGAAAAWLGFTLPSAAVMVLFALALNGLDVSDAGWLHGLKLTAVAVVAQAVWSMGRKLAAGPSRAAIAVFAAGLTLLLPGASGQVTAIAAAALAGLWLYRRHDADIAVPQVAPAPQPPLRRKAALLSLALFFALLLLLPLFAAQSSGAGGTALRLFDSFFRAGSLVFGGGHVVLPLLQSEVVPSGLVGQSDFLAGYGFVQAMPGPLFTFASYLGAVMNGLPGAIIATLAIFLPAFLLIIGVLPFWIWLCRNAKIQSALHGVNAAVVGILLAALYDPIWTSSVLSAGDFMLALLLFAMLAWWKLPPWTTVLSGGAGGMLLSLVTG